MVYINLGGDFVKIIVEGSEYSEVVDWLKNHGASIVKVLKRWQTERGNWVQLDFVTLPQGRRPKIDKSKILSARAEGRSLAEIARSCNCSRAYVQKVIAQSPNGQMSVMLPQDQDKRERLKIALEQQLQQDKDEKSRQYHQAALAELRKIRQ